MTPRHSFAALSACLLGACASPVMQPTGGFLTQEPAQALASAIPQTVQAPAALPRPQPKAAAETYSVVVNGVRVQELLFALARDAKLNVDVHSGISGTVTLNAIDQTLPQLLNRIGKQVDMRWELDGPNLAVMPDTPFLRVYRIDYLNMERSTVGTVGVATQIATPGAAGGTGGGASGGTNASNTSIRNQSSNKFWDTLIENVKDILKETDKVMPTTGNAPGGGAAPQAPGGGLLSAAARSLAGGGAGAGADGGAGGNAGGAPQSAAQQAAAAATSQNVAFREAASVIANPESSLISVRATSRQHERIQEFLDQVLTNARRQVLIEATIMEVQLSNQYQQGIDWSLLRRGPNGLSLTQAATGTSPAAVNSSIFTANLANSLTIGNLTASVRLLESFGNVRVLSSPKISVLNNQSAILKVVDNRVYFTIRADTTATANVGTTTTYTTTPNIVPVGFVMNVTPQISENDVVLLNLKPTVSRIVGFVNDPNPALANPCGIGVAGCTQAPIVSQIPVVQTREMESLLKVNSGQTAVMGGLIQDQLSNTEDGVPGVSRIEGLGSLFGHRNQSNAKTELVIFLRPLVIKDASIDGDYRSFRALLPTEDFLTRPNPAKPAPILVQPQQ